MNVVEPGSPAERMIARVLNLMVRPTAAWEAIAAEEATVERLYRGWVMPLAAIPAVCGAVALIAFGGIHLFGISYKPNLALIIGLSIWGYLVTLGCVYAVAWLVSRLAPMFGGEPDFVQALKLCAYAGTFGWLAGIFLLAPNVGELLRALGSLFSAYQFCIALPLLMRSDPARAVTYFVAVLAGALALFVAIGFLNSRIATFGGPISL